MRENNIFLNPVLRTAITLIQKNRPYKGFQRIPKDLRDLQGIIKLIIKGDLFQPIFSAISLSFWRFTILLRISVKKPSPL
jgi:hypothetical protein